MKFVEIRM